MFGDRHVTPPPDSEGDLPLWLVYLLLGMAVVAFHLWVRPARSDAFHLASVAASGVAVLVGVRRHRPAHTLPWLLIAAGLGVWVLGDTLTLVRGQPLDLPPPGSGLVAILFVCGYALFGAGLVVLARRRGSRGDWGGLIDATVVGVAFGMLAWQIFAAPLSEGHRPLDLAMIAYPAADVLLLGILARLAAARGSRPAALWFLIAGLALLFAADVLGVAMNVHPGAALDLALHGSWLASFVLIGTAGLHPSMASLTVRPAAGRTPVLGWGRLGVLALALLTIPLTFVLVLPNDPLDVATVVATSTILLLLVIGRLATAMGQIRSDNELLGERDRELSRSLEELRVAGEERRHLLSWILSVQEEERERVANAIHDGPMQLMASLGLRLEMAADRYPAMDTDGQFARFRESLNGSLESLRRLMVELRPYVLDLHGLAETLRQDLDARSRLDGAPDYRFEGALDGEAEPPPEARTALFRIAQEALTNAGGHSGASHVEVALEGDAEGVLLRVVDDGVGFDPAAVAATGRRLGLLAMRERAEALGGWCTVASAPGGGTRVEAWVPTRTSSSPGGTQVR